MGTVSLVLPTFNERDGIPALVSRVEQALAGRPHELIFVDDSTDGTEQVIAQLRAQHPAIRLLHREGRRGLASAVVEGMAAANGETICVLDADLQHPPEAIPRLLEALDAAGAELAIGSRYVAGGSYDAFTPLRRMASAAATLLARLLLRRARPVADPLSGFFAVRRRAVSDVALRPLGYKILLEILVRGRIRRVVEVPYRFHARTAGQSKLTARQHGEYLLHLARLVTAHPDDLRFVRFAMVGTSGVGVNMSVLWALTRLGVYYLHAGAAAVFVATTWNFALNDAFTWRDRRSTSAAQIARRYLRYWAITGAGSAIHLALLYLLATAGAPYLLANLAGIAAAVAWNFRANGRWTWTPAEPLLERTVYASRAEDGAASPDGPPPADPTLAQTAFRARLQFARYSQDGPPPRLEIISGNGGAPPRVSVIIPVADAQRSHHLGTLLAQLDAQPFRQFETILVRGDRRQGRAINTAAAIARGDILVTMDDDTRLGHPEVLGALVEAMDRDPTIGIAGVSNLIPPDAPPAARRAMRELPRRSSPLVSDITESDLAEHPCLAIRKELFYRVGGEIETIPRGLDPYLRREVRRLGYRVVVVPGVWIHHLLPSTARGILAQYFRNGVGAAYVRRFYPQFVIEQAEAHAQAVSDATSLPARAWRYAGRLLHAARRGKWIYLGTLLSYAAGYLWGTLTLREDSL